MANLTFNRGERIILKHLYESGYSVDEIAHRLNRTSRTVQSELYRGRLSNSVLPNGRPGYSWKKAEMNCRRRSPEESKKIVLTNETKQILNEIIQMEQELPRNGFIPEKLFLLYRSLNPRNRIQKNDE